LKSEYQIKKQREAVRRTYARRIKQKRCARCGKEKEQLPAYAYCTSCREYKRNYMRMKREQKFNYGQENRNGQTLHNFN